jgi:Flp pilus assembly pilin Flp
LYWVENTMVWIHSRRQSAQSLTEFGLLLALVAIVAIAGLLVFGATVSSMMSTLSHTVEANLSPLP